MSISASMGPTARPSPTGSTTTTSALDEAIAMTPVAHRLLVWEPAAVLHDALRASLGRQSELWETTFVRSPDQLRAALDHVHFDVVLADVDAAGPMGSLLSEVGLRAPWALRVVMGGHGADAAMLDAISAAHRFVARPIDMPRLLDDLAATLRRRMALRDVDALRLAFADTALPAAPGIWIELTRALADPEVGAAEMGSIVERDPAVAAKALSLANSAWFGLPRKVMDVRDAVVLLGGEAVQALVLAAEVSALVGGGVDRDWMARFEAHAAAVARAATVVAPAGVRRAAVAAGLLHDIGSLVLMRHHPKLMLAAAEMDLPTRLGVERDLVGATHAEIGAMLLDAWGLPDELIDAVLDHHRPPTTLATALTLAGVVHIADALVKDPDAALEEGIDHATAVGLADDVEGWVAALTSAEGQD